MTTRHVVLYLFNVILFFSLTPALSENVFPQAKLFAEIKNLYSLNDDAEKIARLSRPRVYQAENEPVKDADEDSKPAAAKAALNMNDIEHRVFDLINQRRAAAGLSLLTWNDNVAGVARVHSRNMASLKFFSHTGADGKKVNNRADALGVKKWRSLGENIAYNRGFKSPLESAVQSWMNSPGHRDNILKSDWQESGIGVVVTDEGAYYLTQVFLKK